jgi:hypothetical protein
MIPQCLGRLLQDGCRPLGVAEEEVARSRQAPRLSPGKTGRSSAGPSPPATRRLKSPGSHPPDSTTTTSIQPSCGASPMASSPGPAPMWTNTRNMVTYAYLCLTSESARMRCLAGRSLLGFPPGVVWLFRGMRRRWHPVRRLRVNHHRLSCVYLISLLGGGPNYSRSLRAGLVWVSSLMLILCMCRRREAFTVPE